MEQSLTAATWTKPDVAGIILALGGFLLVFQNVQWVTLGLLWSGLSLVRPGSGPA